MPKVWLVLGGFALGVVTTTLLIPRRASSRGDLLPSVNLAERELDRVISRIDLDAVPFERAVQDVQKLTSVTIVVDDDALASIHFNRNTPVTMHGSDIPLDQVLMHLAPEESHGAAIGYFIKDGRIVITISAKLAEARAVRCYDIHQALRSSYLDDDPEDGANDSIPTPKSNFPPYWRDDVRAQYLMTLIKDTVATESWSDNGGSVGAMFYIDKRLFICQTWANHHLIARLLADLTASRPASLPSADQPWSELRKAWVPASSIHTQEALIRKPIPQVDLDHQSLKASIEILQHVSGVTIWIDRAELPDAVTDAMPPISLHLTGASLTQALNAIAMLRAADIRLGYVVQDGIVLITSCDKADHNPTVRTYDVRDLLPSADTRTGNEAGDELVRVIESQIDPQSWKDHGGLTGQMHLLHGRLIISQTWTNQVAIDELLTTLSSDGNLHGRARIRSHVRDR